METTLQDPMLTLVAEPVAHQAPALRPERQIAAQSQDALSGPMGMAMQALRAGMTIADMQGLLTIQKDWEANEARKAYVADMAAFKLAPPEIFKRKAVGYESKDGQTTTSYMHATLGDVTSLTVEALAQHGFSHRWDAEQREGGQIHVTCILTHKLGHSERTTLHSSRDDSGKKNNIQAMASTVTYLQRYTLLAACGLATKDMEDDDGRGSETVTGAADVVTGWIDYVNSAESLARLEEMRKEGATAFDQAKDVAGWNKIKAAIVTKRVALQGGAK